MSDIKEQEQLKLYINETLKELQTTYGLTFPGEKINGLLEKLEASSLSITSKIQLIDDVKNTTIKNISSKEHQHEHHHEHHHEPKEKTTFSKIKETIDILREHFNNQGVNLYISGGTVPYLISGTDSNRLHDDIDTVCRLEDMEKIRNILKEHGVYTEELDSKENNDGEIDYGLEANINGVLVGMYPFVKEKDVITQYSYDSEEKLVKSKKINIQEEDFITTYQAPDGSIYHTMTLEFIRKSKSGVGREKDKKDVAAIDRIGYDQEKYDRLTLPFDSKMEKATKKIPVKMT